MKEMQKMGGIAALIAAATFLVGFVLFFSVLESADYGSLDIDPVLNAAFLVDKQAIMYLFYLIIYVLFGVCLVLLTLALHERVKAGSPGMMRAATAFGLIWAGLMFASGMVANIGSGVVVELYGKDPSQAGAVWLALHFVVEGLGGGNEIVGGLWILLTSWAALRGGGLPKALNYLGLVVSVAALVTVVPALGDVGAIFGLGSIVWFIWLGIIMLRKGPNSAAS